MPDISMVHVDQALTEVSVAYRNSQYVADSIFPVVPVTKQSNKYFIYSKDNFRTLDDARRPGARANEIEWALSTDTYYCEGARLSRRPARRWGLSAPAHDPARRRCSRSVGAFRHARCSV